jgi:putative membrane protein insertion efficiency factor
VTAAHRNAGVRLALRAIALYQAARAGRPTSCRFVPSCSAYAAEAIATHGLVRGTRLGLARLARCRPFGPHGVDEVPPASMRAAR